MSGQWNLGNRGRELSLRKKHMVLKYSDAPAAATDPSIKEPISVEVMKNKSYDELHEMFKGNIIPLSANTNAAHTSQYFCSHKFFIKNVIHFSKNNVYDRKILIFKNVGVPVIRENKPNNLETQFNQILNDMKSKNIQHNDIKIGEILMDDKKKIYLCDFGWSSINNNLNCGIDMWGCNNKNKPGGWHNDDTTLTRLGLI
jgi:serine/threonine protein kinase